jgi:GNAT superfamily N-acetyltransferase
MYAIHPLPLCDFRHVGRIFVENFPTIDDTDFAAAWSAIDLCSSMGLYYNATLVGFGLVSDGAIAFLVVQDGHRSGGNGSRLLEAIKATCDSLTLKPVNCTHIIDWYKRHGFVICARMPFIHVDIPTCVMSWSRTESPVSSRSTTRSRGTSSIVSDSGSDGFSSDDEILPPSPAEILSVVGGLRAAATGRNLTTHDL